MSHRTATVVRPDDLEPYGHACMECGGAFNVGDLQYARLVDFTPVGDPIVEHVCEKCDDP